MPTNRTRLKRERREHKQNQQIFLNFFMYGIATAYYAEVKPLEKPEGLLDLFLLQHPLKKDKLISTWQSYKGEVLKLWKHQEIDPYGVLAFDKQKDVTDEEFSVFEGLFNGEKNR